MYGCGCWALGNPGCDRVAVSTSGIVRLIHLLHCTDWDEYRNW